MDKTKLLLKKKNFEVKSVFPPELELECQNHKVNLKYVRGRYCHNLILSIPEKNIEVKFSDHSSDIAEKSLKIGQQKMPELEKYLQLISSLPRKIHEEVLRATTDDPSASIPVLQFLNTLYEKDYIWRNDALWIVDKRNILFTVRPEKKKKAKTDVASLAGYKGQEALEKFVLNGIDVSNISTSWGFDVVSSTSFETATNVLKKRGHEDIAEAIKCAASYISRDTRDKWFKRLKYGLSEKEFQELKKKSENIQKRRKREERYHELYEKFVERRYQYLPETNELLLFPKCKILFGIDMRVEKAEKMESDNYEYHVASRINTGKWPSSVWFRPRSAFYNREIEGLRKSVKKATEEIPQVPADKLRAYFVDWILSEET